MPSSTSYCDHPHFIVEEINALENLRNTVVVEEEEEEEEKEEEEVF